MMVCKLILMPFTTEAASLNAKPGKPKTALIGSIFSHERKCVWFASCEDRRLNQSRSTAVLPDLMTYVAKIYQIGL